jgi:hypothetical protein
VCLSLISLRFWYVDYPETQNTSQTWILKVCFNLMNVKEIKSNINVLRISWSFSFLAAIFNTFSVKMYHKYLCKYISPCNCLVNWSCTIRLMAIYLSSLIQESFRLFILVSFADYTKHVIETNNINIYGQSKADLLHSLKTETIVLSNTLYGSKQWNGLSNLYTEYIDSILHRSYGLFLETSV